LHFYLVVIQQCCILDIETNNKTDKKMTESTTHTTKQVIKTCDFCCKEHKMEVDYTSFDSMLNASKSLKEAGFKTIKIVQGFDNVESEALACSDCQKETKGMQLK
jgi:hypothetical protein